MNRPGCDGASFLVKDADHAQALPRRAATRPSPHYGPSRSVRRRRLTTRSAAESWNVANRLRGVQRKYPTRISWVPGIAPERCRCARIVPPLISGWSRPDAVPRGGRRGTQRTCQHRSPPAPRKPEAPRRADMRIGQMMDLRSVHSANPNRIVSSFWVPLGASATISRSWGDSTPKFRNAAVVSAAIRRPDSNVGGYHRTNRSAPGS